MAAKSNSSISLVQNDTPMWYTVQVYSGFEKNVVEEIKHLAQLNKKEGDFVEFYYANQSLEEVNSIDNKKYNPAYPGYIFVKMKLNNKTFEIIHSVNRTIGFLGGEKFAPKPLTETQFNKMVQDIESVSQEVAKATFQVGDIVKIKEGSFQSLAGIVTTVDLANSRISVSVKVFDREMSIDLSFDQIEKEVASKN